MRLTKIFGNHWTWDRPTCCYPQMASPKTLTMQYMVLFSHRTVQFPVEKQVSIIKSNFSIKLGFGPFCFKIRKVNLKYLPSLTICLTICTVVPETWAGSVQACPIFLEYDGCHWVNKHKSVNLGRNDRHCTFYISISVVLTPCYHTYVLERLS